MNDLIWKEKKNYKQRKKIFLCLLFCFNAIFFKLVFKEKFKWLNLTRIFKNKKNVFVVVVVIKNITLSFINLFFPQYCIPKN